MKMLRSLRVRLLLMTMVMMGAVTLLERRHRLLCGREVAGLQRLTNAVQRLRHRACFRTLIASQIEKIHPGIAE